MGEFICRVHSSQRAVTVLATLLCFVPCGQLSSVQMIGEANAIIEFVDSRVAVT